MIPPLIGFAGKKQSGKDTAFAILHNALLNKGRPVIKWAFADQLKKEVAHACNVSLLFIEENKEDMRLILQGWGTDFRRKHYGEDYWIEKWKVGIKNLQEMQPTAVIVAPDVRFKNEAAVIKELGGQVIKIVGHNRQWEDDKHPSETEMDSFDKFDCLIENDFNDVNVMKNSLTHYFEL